MHHRWLIKERLAEGIAGHFHFGNDHGGQDAGKNTDCCPML